MFEDVHSGEKRLQTEEANVFDAFELIHGTKDKPSPGQFSRLHEDTNKAAIKDFDSFVQISKGVLDKINPDGQPVSKSELAKVVLNLSFKGQEAQAVAALYGDYNGFFPSLMSYQPKT